MEIIKQIIQSYESNKTKLEDLIKLYNRNLIDPLKDKFQVFITKLATNLNNSTVTSNTINIDKCVKFVNKISTLTYEFKTNDKLKNDKFNNISTTDGISKIDNIDNYKNFKENFNKIYVKNADDTSLDKLILQFKKFLFSLKKVYYLLNNSTFNTIIENNNNTHFDEHLKSINSYQGFIAESMKIIETIKKECNKALLEIIKHKYENLKKYN